MILSLITLLFLGVPLLAFQRLSLVSEGSFFFDREKTTYYKGLAVLLVVVCHTVSNTVETVLAKPLGGVGVAIFLLLSGYGLQESFKKNKLQGYWWKRVLRVFIPYALFIFVVEMVNRDFETTKYLKDICFIDSSYWYMSYLVLWYIAFYISSLLGAKWKYVVLLAGAILSFCLFSGMQAEQSWCFPLGVVASAKKDKLIECKSFHWVYLGVVLMVVGIVSLALKSLPAVRANEWTFKLSMLFVKLPLGLALILLTKNMLRTNKLVKSCGVMSLEIYLVHMQTLHLIKYDSVENYVWSFLVFMVSTIVLSILFHKICKWISSIPVQLPY